MSNIKATDNSPGRIGIIAYSPLGGKEICPLRRRSGTKNLVGAAFRQSHAEQLAQQPALVGAALIGVGARQREELLRPAHAAQRVAAEGDEAVG